VPFHPLAKNDVHLWFLPDGAAEIERLCAAGDDLLTPDERQRYQSYQHSGRAKQFLLGRILMRRSLAAHLAADAGELRFSYGPAGKPELHRAIASEIVFSLSHARSSAVMAIACAARIGVDLEMQGRASSVLGIARQFFSEAERRQLEPQSAAAASKAMALWGLKESIVKASGSSIWEGLSAVRLALNGEHIKWLSAPPDGPEFNWLLMCGSYQTDRSLALALQRKHPMSEEQKIHTHILGNESAGDNCLSVSRTSRLVSTG
jgi:4'-phosphopantetheinyl transferase